MIKKLVASFLSICFLTCVVCHSATADPLTIRFSTNGGSSFATSFNVQTGNPISFGIYLHDGDSNGVLVTDGLAGFGMIGTPVPTTLGTISSTTINPVFDVPADLSTSTLIDWQAGVLINSPPTGQAILLGDFTFQSNFDGQTVFDFTDKATPDWISGTGAILDADVFSNGPFRLTINSTSVPEPTSTCLLLCSLIALGYRRR